MVGVRLTERPKKQSHNIYFFLLNVNVHTSKNCAHCNRFGVFPQDTSCAKHKVGLWFGSCVSFKPNVCFIFGRTYIFLLLCSPPFFKKIPTTLTTPTTTTRSAMQVFRKANTRWVVPARTRSSQIRGRDVRCAGLDLDLACSFDLHSGIHTADV